MNVVLIFILCIPAGIANINLQVDGLIDLGLKWNYEYKISEVNNSTTINTGKSSSQKPQYYFTLPLRRNQKASNFFSKTRNNSKVLEDLRYDKILKNKRKRHKNKHKIKNNNNTIFTYIQKYMNLNNIQTYNSENKKFTNDLKQNKQISRDYLVFNEKNFHEIYDKKKSIHIMSTDENNVFRRVTQINYPTYNHNDIFVKEHRLEEKEIPYKFMLHIYKQFLRLFDNIKGKFYDWKLDQDLKKFKRFYKEQFEPIFNTTLQHVKIKTKLGIQKLLSNIMATSNIILNHIFNQLPEAKTEIFKKELSRQNEMENQHACYTLGICQKSSVFGDFLVDILTIILQGNEFKVQQAINAWTESLKYTYLTNIFYSPIRNKIQKLITEIESQPINVNRPILLILRSALARRDMPIYIMGKNDKYSVNVTVTFRELIQIIDESCTKYNPSAKWGEFKKNLQDWSDGKRNDILTIMDMIIKSIKYSLEKMTFQERTKLNEIVKTLFKHLFKMEVLHQDTLFTSI